MAFGAPAGRAAPSAALYLNVGQLGWAAPLVGYWLRHRPDVRPVFMLHDVIPIEHPHLVSYLGHATHKQMVATAARHAAGLISTTATAGASVLEALRVRGREAPPMVALPLPVAPVFLQPEAPDPRLAAHTYFLLCGAVEPRKNHLLLLQVWEELVRRLGEGAPRLVVAGSPARGGKSILQQLERCGTLRRHLIVATGLSSPALRRLMAGARALLMPSLAEGFGLPIIEALTLGTPVLASDLPAHREVGGDLACYLNPRDVMGWVREINRLTADEAHAEALRRHVATYRPMTAIAYFARIEQFLERLGCDRSSSRG
jgi:glycosyltransferase involved in cell wall biosynthesis